MTARLNASQRRAEMGSTHFQHHGFDRRRQLIAGTIAQAFKARSLVARQPTPASFADARPNLKPPPSSAVTAMTALYLCSVSIPVGGPFTGSMHGTLVGNVWVTACAFWVYVHVLGCGSIEHRVDELPPAAAGTAAQRRLGQSGHNRNERNRLSHSRSPSCDLISGEWESCPCASVHEADRLSGPNTAFGMNALAPDAPMRAAKSSRS